MNLDIARLTVTLQDVSPDLGAHIGAHIGELLGDALQGRLSGPGPNDGAGGGADHTASGGTDGIDTGRHGTHRLANLAHLDRLDLGFIEAPPGADARVLSQLIAAQLAGWIGGEEA